MAHLVANSSGNFNTAGTWDTVRNTPTLHATTNISVTTGGVKTVGFTAPNTTNAATGVMIFAASYPSSGRDWTATLEESGVATAAVATILQSDMPITAGWVYFRLATPYVYTTTTASAYKWIIKSTVANSGTVAADSGAGNPCFLSTENTNAAPGADQIYILAHNCTTAITVTVDGTSGSVWGGTNDFVGFGLRKLTVNNCVIGGALANSTAVLEWDRTANSTCVFTTITGVYDGGEIRMGTVASPQPQGIKAYLRKSGNSVRVTSLGTGIISMVGYPLTYYKTSYVSGAGTAASPLVVSDPVDWTVGDYIATTATSNNATNYNETEFRYIITKNSSTSYVLSSTSGGAETAYTYTHSTSAFIINLTRNVVCDNTTVSNSISIEPSSTSSSVFQWANLLSLGLASAGNSPSSVGAFALNIPTVNNIPVDYCSFGSANGYALIIKSTSSTSYTGNIFYSSAAAAAQGTCAALGITGQNLNFIDHIFISNSRQGVEYRGTNCTLTNPILISNNTGGIASQGALYLASGAPITVLNPKINCNRISGITLAGTSNSEILSGDIGTIGVNQDSDVAILAGAANNILFSSVNCGSTNLVTGHTSGAIGATLIAFDTLNGTVNNHIWYTEYGSARSTGAGLSDTTVRTSGTLNVRMYPENSTTGFSWSYKILAIPGRAVSALGFIQRNAAFSSDDCIVELFLPGSTVADATQTMGTTSGSYLVYNIAAVYSGSISRYATVKITGKTTNSSAYLYIADLFNGTNHIIDLTTWDNGQPSPIMFEQLGDAAAVWAVPLSTLTTAGTTGKKQVDNLTFVQSLL